MKIKSLIIAAPYPFPLIVEKADGSIAMFDAKPAREIKEQDLHPLKAFFINQEAAQELEAPEYMYALYGLQKIREPKRKMKSYERSDLDDEVDGDQVDDTQAMIKNGHQMTDDELMKFRFVRHNMKKNTGYLAKLLGMDRRDFEAAVMRGINAEAREWEERQRRKEENERDQD